MPAKDRLNIFISHSSKDKAFARELDASLSRHGVDVFLDERAIKVGDSIPARIYEGIANATHLIYVISQYSLQSSWVQEELDIAKMRQKENLGCKILPVVIDDSKPPTAVQHIKYASFANWQDSSSFWRSLNQLLDVLDISVTAPTRVDLNFFVAEQAAYAELEALVTRIAEYLKKNKGTPILFT